MYAGRYDDNMPVIPLKQLTYTPDQEKMVGSILDQLDIAERIKEDPGSIFEKGDSEVLEFAAGELDTRYGKWANEKIAALLRLADLAKKLRK